MLPALLSLQTQRVADSYRQAVTQAVTDWRRSKMWTSTRSGQDVSHGFEPVSVTGSILEQQWLSNFNFVFRLQVYISTGRCPFRVYPAFPVQVYNRRAEGLHVGASRHRNFTLAGSLPFWFGQAARPQPSGTVEAGCCYINFIRLRVIFDVLTACINISVNAIKFVSSMSIMLSMHWNIHVDLAKISYCYINFIRFRVIFEVLTACIDFWQDFRECNQVCKFHVNHTVNALFPVCSPW